MLADESTPSFRAGAMTLAASLYKDEAKIRDAFKCEASSGWVVHDHDLFHCVSRFRRATETPLNWIFDVRK